MSAKENLLDFEDLDRLLDVKDIALLLKKSVLTIRKDVHRRPKTLPPRAILPGDARLLVWRRSDCIKWFASLSASEESAQEKKQKETKRGPGRPPICRQIAVHKHMDVEPMVCEGLNKDDKPKAKGGRPRKDARAGGVK